MQKIATQIFIGASVVFGVLGIFIAFIEPNEDDSIVFRLLMADGFIVLSSFGVSVATKYLKVRD